MAAPLVERSKGDTIPASDHNDVKDYIEDASYRVNTLALEINGVEIIDSNGYVKSVRLQCPDSGGIPIYASDGSTQIGLIDNDGNLRLKGRVMRL